MRNFHLAISASVAVTAIVGVGAASAADLPARTYTKAPPLVSPAYNWTGFYIGVNAGGHQSRDSDPAAFLTNNYFTFPDNVTAANAFPYVAKGSGFAGGAQAGYNVQVSSFVLGVEADVMGLSNAASRNSTFLENGGATFATLNDRARDNWMATFRGKVGVAFDRIMLYGTGGLAVSNWSLLHTLADTGGPTPTQGVSFSTTQTGWTAGVGLEYAVSDNWSVRGEYLYADFGRVGSVVNFVFPPMPVFAASIQHSDRLTENIARVAVNYRFGGPVLAKY